MAAAYIKLASLDNTFGVNFTRNTVFSLRGGTLDEMLAGFGGPSPSSRATECAVTRAENPVPSRMPAMIPDKYASTDSPPKSAGTETNVLS